MLHSLSSPGQVLNVFEAGAGPPLLFVHGFPLDHTMWRNQLEFLSRTHRVIAPDLRGFGRSGVIEGTAHMADFADELAELLSALGETHPVIFCGLSMGGYIAWQFAKRHRQRLAALVVMDSRAAADDAESARARLVSAERLEREGTDFLVSGMLPRLFGEELLRNPPEFVEQTRRVMLGTDRRSCAAAQRGMAARADMRAILPTLNLPTLILCGETDIISPAAEMRDIAAAIPGAQYAEIAGAGHMAPLEKPAEVNAALSGFLNSLE